jgi:hypothetical protein
MFLGKKGISCSSVGKRRGGQEDTEAYKGGICRKARKMAAWMWAKWIAEELFKSGVNRTGSSLEAGCRRDSEGFWLMQFMGRCLPSFAVVRDFREEPSLVAGIVTAMSLVLDGLSWRCL